MAADQRYSRRLDCGTERKFQPDAERPTDSLENYLLATLNLMDLVGFTGSSIKLFG